MCIRDRSMLALPIGSGIATGLVIKYMFSFLLFVKWVDLYKLSLLPPVTSQLTTLYSSKFMMEYVKRKVYILHKLLFYLQWIVGEGEEPRSRFKDEIEEDYLRKLNIRNWKAREMCIRDSWYSGKQNIRHHRRN